MVGFEVFSPFSDHVSFKAGDLWLKGEADQSTIPGEI